MSLTSRLHRRCRRKFPKEYTADNERFDKAVDFAHKFFEEHPGGTEAGCKAAAMRSGFDPFTISLICSLAYIAWEVFKAWRNRT